MNRYLRKLLFMKDEWLTHDKFHPSKKGIARLKEGTATNLCLCEIKWIGSRNVPFNARFKVNPSCPVHGS